MGYVSTLAPRGDGAKGTSQKNPPPPPHPSTSGFQVQDLFSGEFIVTYLFSEDISGQPCVNLEIDVIFI